MSDKKQDSLLITSIKIVLISIVTDIVALFLSAIQYLFLRYDMYYHYNPASVIISYLLFIALVVFCWIKNIKTRYLYLKNNSRGYITSFWIIRFVLAVFEFGGFCITAFLMLGFMDVRPAVLMNVGAFLWPLFTFFYPCIDLLVCGIKGKKNDR